MTVVSLSLQMSDGVSGGVAALAASLNDELEGRVLDVCSELAEKVSLCPPPLSLLPLLPLNRSPACPPHAGLSPLPRAVARPFIALHTFFSLGDSRHRIYEW